MKTAKIVLNPTVTLPYVSVIKFDDISSTLAEEDACGFK